VPDEAGAELPVGAPEAGPLAELDVPGADVEGEGEPLGVCVGDGDPEGDDRVGFGDVGVPPVGDMDVGFEGFDGVGPSVPVK
jgi:hypothetical protein